MKYAFRLLRSPRLALGVLIYLAVYGGIAAWLPWSSGAATAPVWAASVGINHPFSSVAFLAGCLVLFLSTLACTWVRTRQIWLLWSGDSSLYNIRLKTIPGQDFLQFLREQGFKGNSSPYFRHRFALWGGWILHIGLLSLMVGVLIQQGFHQGGAFELTEGETATLSDPGVVFARAAGPLASKRLPPIQVTLLSFDPFLHQEGYAPDRASKLLFRSEKGESAEQTLDRAEGARFQSLTFYQAIPIGLALNVEIPGMGGRSIHLRSDSDHSASTEVVGPAGDTVRFTAKSERRLNDPMGTGVLQIQVERHGVVLPIRPENSFPFGFRSARLISVTRWGGFTFSRSPGMPAVFWGFLFVLSGCLLLVFPSGAAWTAQPESPDAGWIYVKRGADALAAEWENKTAVAQSVQKGESAA